MELYELTFGTILLPAKLHYQSVTRRLNQAAAIHLTCSLQALHKYTSIVG